MSHVFGASFCHVKICINQPQWAWMWTHSQPPKLSIETCMLVTGQAGWSPQRIDFIFKYLYSLEQSITSITRYSIITWQVYWINNWKGDKRALITPVTLNDVDTSSSYLQLYNIIIVYLWLYNHVTTYTHVRSLLLKLTGVISIKFVIRKM